jgi:DNA replicative helicase MCM subunit Mcm2 (Cdc46/Mcm family)
LHLVVLFLEPIAYCDEMVTKMSLIHQKFVEINYFLTATNQHSHKVYPVIQYWTKILVELFDSRRTDRKPLEMENRLSIFIDHQTASLHERSESLSEGQILRICKVMIADHDLTNMFESGDRILVYDIL